MNETDVKSVLAQLRLGPDGEKLTREQALDTPFTHEQCQKLTWLVQSAINDPEDEPRPMSFRAWSLLVKRLLLAEADKAATVVRVQKALQND